MDNYSRSLETFLFKRSWGEAFKDLTEVQAGKLIKAIYLFTEGQDATPEETELKTLYKMITSQLNYSARSYVIKAGLDYDTD